jgi:hypothetical protein
MAVQPGMIYTQAFYDHAVRRVKAIEEHHEFLTDGVFDYQKLRNANDSWTLMIYQDEVKYIELYLANYQG